MIPVIDIFAGPGGLGEGFSSFLDARGRRLFRLAVSFEKDPSAHATLRLRAFSRMFERPPAEYRRFIDGELTWAALSEAYPREAGKAEAEAQRVELGLESVGAVRSRISAAVSEDEPWVLIGGPPCQAYSVAGRSRNKGNADYRAEHDHRQTLYVEYLQILADHAPPVFVMENVKGLLSARLNRQRLFDRIREDLQDPGAALKREGRTGKRRPRYRIRALLPTLDSLRDDPTGFVIESERFGVPQRRHRVILVGVREGGVADSEDAFLVPLKDACTVHDAIADLPRVRSGLSRVSDSDEAWAGVLDRMRRERWLKGIDSLVRARIVETIGDLRVPAASRGADVLRRNGRTVFNHATRSHIHDDLSRYMFASAFAAANGRSPLLRDFPSELLPNHENVRLALRGGFFADRFRVQVANEPSTTVTSHISKDGHYYIHFDAAQCRSLTVREAARLQTFPDDYFFCGNRTMQYQQVGNAVPPKLAGQIASVVARMLGK